VNDRDCDYVLSPGDAGGQGYQCFGYFLASLIKMKGLSGIEFLTSFVQQFENSGRPKSCRSNQVLQNELLLTVIQQSTEKS
jgi:hypothetical protein